MVSKDKEYFIKKFFVSSFLKIKFLKAPVSFIRNYKIILKFKGLP